MMNSNHHTPFQWLKRSLVGIIGRERANQIAGPYHDRQARRRTLEFLGDLPENDLCVNLGCGYRPMKGWVNVDRARGPEVQVVWNLTEGLPFPDSSCDAVFSEHFIEHISKEDAARFLGECYRVLKTSGVLRISTPDAELFLRSYAGDQKFLVHSSFSQEIDTSVDRVNYMMREYGQHLWSYDEELLTLMLKRAGFNSIIRQRFGISLHPRMNDIDFADRAFESLYLEAVKEDK
ncbi:MAG TPA: methyltransferase domain-containing protein [Pyrinomonadaceae bacterium]|nr:methyltransferase domain-containing protein [Pyrinomonadaceae bacterium]